MNQKNNKPEWAKRPMVEYRTKVTTWSHVCVIGHTLTHQLWETTAVEQMCPISGSSLAYRWSDGTPTGRCESLEERIKEEKEAPEVRLDQLYMHFNVVYYREEDSTEFCWMSGSGSWLHAKKSGKAWILTHVQGDGSDCYLSLFT